jgi:signal transduction histidine kinase
VKLVRHRDALVPLVLAVLSTVELLGLDADRKGRAIAVDLVACGLLVGRRRWPWAIPTIAGVLPLLVPYLGPELDEPATPILIVGVASWTMGRHLRDLRGLASMGLFLLVILSDYALTTVDQFDISDLVFVCVVLLPPFVAGLGARSLADRNSRLSKQAAELLRLQEAVRTEAAAAERGRIARELHDVIAHSVSAMVLQASAAAELVRRDPERAASAVNDIATTGRRALAETGRLLHLIRDSDDELGLAPDVGLERLAELVDGFRRNGLAVDLEVEGSLAGLPAGVDLSGYRIVQEALTNALKHARDRNAHVQVRRTRDALHIRADNAAAGPGQQGVGSGLGLVGIAERVSVFGGTLRHGIGDDGRWVLQAELPLASADA